MALSWIRHPEAVFVRVALPLAAGASFVGPRAAWKRSAELPERRTVIPIATTSTAVTAAPARTKPRGARTRRERRWASMRARRAGGASTSVAALRANETARSCSRQTVGELRGGGNLLAKSSTALRVERSVGERRQLGDLILVVSPASHRHTKGNAVGMVRESSHTCIDHFPAKLFPRRRTGNTRRFLVSQEDEEPIPPKGHHDSHQEPHGRDSDTRRRATDATPARRRLPRARDEPARARASATPALRRADRSLSPPATSRARGRRRAVRGSRAATAFSSRSRRRTQEPSPGA